MEWHNPRPSGGCFVEGAAVTGQLADTVTRVASVLPALRMRMRK